MNSLVLQWHITSRCNLRCKHCYQESYNTVDIDTIKIDDVLYKFDLLLKDIKRIGHINITGGEPLINYNIKHLINRIENIDSIKSYGLLSNGTLINDKIIEIIKTKKLSFVQISIDGNLKNHDNLRGKNSFNLAKCGIKKLVSNNIKVIVSFTANKQNYKDFKKVVKFCIKNKVFKVWTDRMVPFGNAEMIEDLFIDKETIINYVNCIKDCFKYNKDVIVEDKRGFQFLANGSIPYSCKAGDSIIAILEDGTVFPCRRLPIEIGNVYNEDLINIFNNNKFLEDLRNKKISECKNCSLSKVCNGGAKCISYSIFNDPFRKDPSCPMS